MVTEHTELQFRLGFGQVVRQRRQAMGVSQEELADRCNLHRTFISEIERGLKTVSLLSLLRLAEALDTPAHTLIEEVELLIKETSDDIRP